MCQSGATTVLRMWAQRPFQTKIQADDEKNKKHLKNVGPIHHCEPPHDHSPDVASGTVASMSTTPTTTTRDRGDRYGPMEWAQ